jgi:Glycosyl transferases group 1
MLKLIVAPKSALGGYISREFFFIIENLERRFGWKQLETWELANDHRTLRTILLDRLGSIPDVILFWEQYDVFTWRARELWRLGTQIGIWADDIHSFSEAARLGRVVPFVVADKVLAYANRFEEFYPFIRKGTELIWVPHSASADFVVPLNEKPERAVFLSGAMTGHYPLRRQMKALSEESRLPIILFDHPGYHCEFDHESDERVGRGYAKNIARHLAAFTDGLIYNYLVAKFFEIPAAGALLLGEERMQGALARLGFRDGIHYLAVGPENLKPRIEEALDPSNRKVIDEIRRQGQKLVLERHLAEHRARQIDEVFEGTGSQNWI